MMHVRRAPASPPAPPRGCTPPHLRSNVLFGFAEEAAKEAEWAWAYTFAGYDTQGDGTKIAAFKFGEPGEEASGNRVDALEITVTAKRVRETTEPIVHQTVPTPDGSKRCKKFYQPHVEAGDAPDDAPSTSTKGNVLIVSTQKKH